MGNELRKLREDAQSAAPSPDGMMVAFLTQDHKEIWLMSATGADPHKVLGPEDGVNFLQVAWAPEGDRLGFLKDYWKQQKRTIESYSVKAGGAAGAIWSEERLKNFAWVPGGRIIGTVTDAAAGVSGAPSHSDLWEARVDPASGIGRGSPRRLTNLAGFKPISLSVTADGKRLVLIRSYDQSDVYAGALQAGGTRLDQAQRMTLDDRIDWPGGWTRDSKNVLFSSDRQGSLDVFEQKIGETMPMSLEADAGEKRQPQMSPDGMSILYLTWPSGAVAPTAGKLMRIPVAGGPPQTVLTVQGYAGSSETPRDSGTFALTSSGYPDFRCPSRGSRCVVAEIDSGKVTFSRFDPAQGAKSDAGGLAVEEPSFWDLSPDGSKIAVAELAHNNRIRVLTIGGSTSEIAVKDFRLITSIAWASNGTSFFVAGTAPEGGAVIRHLGADGHSELLYKADAWLERPMPSPDGKWLAFGQATSSNNVWALDNLNGR